MSTLTIPNTLSGDSTLRSDKIDANFKAIADYLNGAAGGIDGSNLSIQLTVAQLAEARAVYFLAVPFMVDATNKPRRPGNRDSSAADVEQPTFDQYVWTAVLREPSELLAARIAIRKTIGSTAVGNAHVAIFPGPPQSRQYQAGYELVFDEAKTNSYGYAAPVPNFQDKVLAPGSMLNAYVVSQSNCIGVYLQLMLASEHISRGLF